MRTNDFIALGGVGVELCMLQTHVECMSKAKHITLECNENHKKEYNQEHMAYIHNIHILSYCIYFVTLGGGSGHTHTHKHKLDTLNNITNMHICTVTSKTRWKLS